MELMFGSMRPGVVNKQFTPHYTRYPEFYRFPFPRYPGYNRFDIYGFPSTGFGLPYSGYYRNYNLP
jgi:hypothetical protein